MRPKALVFLLAALTVTTTASAQGDTGFLRGKGKHDFALSYALDSYDHFWVGDQKVEDPGVGEVERANINFWGAYGLSDDIDLVLNASYVHASSDGMANFPSESDLQDLVLGMKWRACGGACGSGESAFFFAPSIKLPMTDYEDNNVTAIGDGQIDLRFRGIAHYQVGGFWGSLETGYDKRNGAPKDEIPLNVTLGGNLGPVTIMPYYSQVFSRGGIDIDEIGGTQGGFPSLEEEYSRLGLSLYGRIVEGIGVTAGYRTTLDGKNTGDVDSWTIGLVGSL